MGICSSSGSGDSKKGSRKGGIKRANERVDDKENFNLGLSAFITENRNKITREYNLLSPPLGKGAFGEVR